MGLLLVALFFVFFVVYSAESESWPTAPQTVQAMLGALAGAMCRLLREWTAGGGNSKGQQGNGITEATPSNSWLVISGTSEGQQATQSATASPNNWWLMVRREQPTQEATTNPNNWWLLIFAGALASVVLLALLAPYAPTMLDRATDFKTPYLEVQLATSAAETQLVLDIDRDLVPVEMIEKVPRGVRFLQYDCGQALIEAMGRGDVNFSQGESYKDFVNADAFLTRSDFSKFARRAVNVRRRVDNDEVVKARLRVVANKLLRLVSDPPESFHPNYQEALSEVTKQDTLLAQQYQVGNDLPPEDMQYQNEVQPWCRDDKADPNKEETVKSLVKTRFILGFVAALLHTIGDTEGVIFMYSLAKKNPGLEMDINVNDRLGAALYIGGRDLSQVTSLFNIALSTVKSNEKTVNDLKALSRTDIDSRIIEALQTRYNRARLILTLQLAYLWAQETLRPPEDPWSTSSRLATAQIYVDDAYRRFREDKDKMPTYACNDDGMGLVIKDAYAYVMLAALARDLRVYKTPVDKIKLHHLMIILEDAKAEAGKIKDEISDAKKKARVKDVALPCMLESEAIAWGKRTTNHLELAKALAR
jgi:hypothetical protein